MHTEKFIISAIFVFASTAKAYAYIDPGTGSVVTTAILGLFAAIGYTFRKYMYRIKDLLAFNKASGAKGNSGARNDG
jgi:hypothetical protein